MALGHVEVGPVDELSGDEDFRVVMQQIMHMGTMNFHFRNTESISSQSTVVEGI